MKSEKTLDSSVDIAEQSIAAIFASLAMSYEEENAIDAVERESDASCHRNRRIITFFDIFPTYRSRS